MQNRFGRIAPRFWLLLLLLAGFVNSAATPLDAAQSSLNKELTIDLGGGIRMEFVLIQPGSFQMGSDKNNNEKPIHTVRIIKPFYIGKFLVTQEQWESVLGSNPSEFKGAQNPVQNVSWKDCQRFIAKLKETVPAQQFSLPTEAQWEYACRSGSTNDYCYGNGEDGLREYAWFDTNAHRLTHPVGVKKPNAWGLYDMHGNVFEWCQDVYHFGYDGAPAFGNAWTQGDASLRVLRGGAWGSAAAVLRSASRVSSSSIARSHFYGVRLAIIPP